MEPSPDTGPSRDIELDNLALPWELIRKNSPPVGKTLIILYFLLRLHSYGGIYDDDVD